MFGSKKESNQDLRRGMWEKGPAKRTDFGATRPVRERTPDIASPSLRPQSEGQTTHE
jgi:hypothetical protein